MEKNPYQMTNLTDNIIAIEVPEGAKISEVTEWTLYYFLGDKQYLICLPPGNWKILCTTRTCTPEQAREITGELLYPSIALAGMLKGKGLDGEKNYCLLEKL